MKKCTKQVGCLLIVLVANLARHNVSGASQRQTTRDGTEALAAHDDEPPEDDRFKIWPLVEEIYGDKQDIFTEDGSHISLDEVKELFNKIRNGKHLQELNELERYILNTLFLRATKAGHKFSIRGKPVENWQEIFKHVTATFGRDVLWNIILKSLNSTEGLTLSNGDFVPLEEIRSTINAIRRGRKMEDLNNREKSVLENIFDKVGKAGYNFKVQGRDAKSWMEIYNYIQRPNRFKNEICTRSIDLWEKIMKILNGRRDFRLNNNELLKLNDLEKLVDEIRYGKNIGDVTREERALLKFLLKKSAATNNKFKIDGKEATTWQELFTAITKYPKANITCNKTSDFWKIVLQVMERKPYIELEDSKKVPAYEIYTLLNEISEGKEASNLNSTEQDVMKYLFYKTQEYGYDFTIDGRKVASWLELCKYIQRTEGPESSFFKKQRMKTWENIWKIIIEYQKNGGSLKISNGVTVPWKEVNKLLELLQEGKKANITREEKAVLKYLFKILEEHDFKLSSLEKGEKGNVKDFLEFISSDSSPRPTTTTQIPQTDVTLREFLEIIRNPRDKEQELVRYNGNDIPLEYINYSLKHLRSADKNRLDNLTVSKVIELLEEYKDKRSGESTKLPNISDEEATLSEITQVLSAKEAPDLEDLVIEYNDEYIPLNYILTSLVLSKNKTKHFDPSNIKPEEIIRVLTTNNNTNNSNSTPESLAEIDPGLEIVRAQRPPTKSEEFTDELLNLITSKPSYENEHMIIQYEDQDVPVRYFIDELSLESDPKTDKYNVTGIPKAEFIRVLDKYRNIKNCTADESFPIEDKTADQILEILTLEPAYEAKRQVISFENQRIPVCYIIEELELHTDPQTGKYQTGNLPKKKLLHALNILQHLTMVTTTDPSITDHPWSESEILYLPETTEPAETVIINYPINPISKITTEIERAEIEITTPEAQTTTPELPAELDTPSAEFPLREIGRDVIDNITETLSTLPSNKITNIKINFGKKTIPLIDIIKDLGLQPNNYTEKYDPKDIDEHKLFYILRSHEKSTTDIPLMELQETVDKVSELLSKDPKGNATIDYKGKHIPLKFLIYKLNLKIDPHTKSYHLGDVPGEELLTLLEDYEEETTPEPFTTSPANVERIPKPGTVENVIHTLTTDSPENLKNKNTTYKNQIIPLRHIITQLDLKPNPASGKYDSKDIPKEKVIKILDLYIRKYLQSNYKQVMQILGSHTPKGINKISISNKGINIPASFIVEELGLKVNDSTGKYNTDNVTKDQFSRVLDLYIDMQKNGNASSSTGSPVPNTPEQLLSSISDSSADDLDNTLIQYNKQNIPVRFIVENLGLKLNPDTNRYDTKDVSKEKLLRVLDLYIPSEARPTVSNISDQILNILRNSPAERVDTESLVYKNKSIPLHYIVMKLGLKVDPETGKYSIRDVTPEDCSHLLNSYVDNPESPSERKEDPLFSVLLNSPAEKALQSTLNYKGEEIPIKYIADKLNLKKNPKTGNFDLSGISTKNFTVVLDLYIKERDKPLSEKVMELKYTTEASFEIEDEISDDLGENEETVNLQQLEKLLKSGKFHKDKKIKFEGQRIPMRFILNVLESQDMQPANLSQKNLYNIIDIYIADKRNNQDLKLPRKMQRIMDPIVERIKDQGENVKGKIKFNGTDIPFKHIVEILLMKRKPLHKVTPTDIWVILKNLLELRSIDPSTFSDLDSEEKLRIYHRFLQIIAESDDVPNTMLKINNIPVELQKVVDILGLKKDKSTGKYDTRNLPYDKVWDVLLDIMNTANNTQERSDFEDKHKALQFFLRAVANVTEVPYTMLKVNGIAFPLEKVVDTLGLQINKATGKYDTESLSEDKLWAVITDMIEKHKGNGSNSPKKK